MIDENSTLDERYEKCKECGDYKVEHCDIHDKNYCLVCGLNCPDCKEEDDDEVDEAIYKNNQRPYVF
jgi:hypothetical protein